MQVRHWLRGRDVQRLEGSPGRDEPDEPGDVQRLKGPPGQEGPDEPGDVQLRAHRAGLFSAEKAIPESDA